MGIKKIESPSEFSAKRNCTIFIAGVFSLYLEFLLMYVPSIRSPNIMYMDWDLGAFVAILISILDVIYIYGMILKSHTPYVPTKFNAFGKQKLNKKEPNYLKSLFIIDLLAILPLPQYTVWYKNTSLFWWITIRLAFKIIAMSPTPQRTAKMMGIMMKNAWFGALQNLFYFIVISNALGAIYYDSYIILLRQCYETVQLGEPDASTLHWDELIRRCTENYEFDYGTFSDALTTKIGTRSFMQKYTYCLAWGLKSLSSFGQVFSPSSYSMDTLLSFIVIISGLILFGDLLARMQTALQCTEVKEDRQRARQRMAEEWMNYHQLPQSLRKQVKLVIQSEWSTTQGVNEDALLDSLPGDIQCEIRRYMYLEIIRTMSLFDMMDNDLLNAICGYLRTFSSSKRTYIAYEGEPVRQILFIFNGQLEVSTASNGAQCMILGPGDLCGKELLKWCLHPTTSTENLIPATQTIKCITDVDAFALRVDAVKLLAIQFHRDGKFCSAFRRYAMY